MGWGLLSARLGYVFHEYAYDNVKAVVNELEFLSRAVNIPGMVRLMKLTVPEYISGNPRFRESGEAAAM